MTKNEKYAFPNRPQFKDALDRANYGMSKREYIATRMMAGLLTKYTINTAEDQQILAQLSVELTDSLLNELSKSNP